MRSLFSITVLGVLAAMVIVAAPAGAQTATCQGKTATHVGTSGDDVIIGTDNDDVIVALDGNDRVFAGDGDDTVCLGRGNDFARGQKGADLILGEGGNDIIYGNAKADDLRGGFGNDVLWGGVGPDALEGGPGRDIIHAGHGNDIATGGDGADKINGSTGADELFGNEGNDTMTGGKGFDSLVGGNGRDLITGGPGNDTIDAGNGFDRCRFDALDHPLYCEGGAISGSNGFGDGSFTVALTDEFVLPGEPPGGPYHVMYHAVIPRPGETVRIVARDGAGAVTFDLTLAGDNSIGMFLLDGGVPATVEVTGADEWSAGFVKGAVIAQDIVYASQQGSDIFGLSPPLDGQAQSVVFTATNEGTVASFVIPTWITSDGFVAAADSFFLDPGQTEVLEGLVDPSTQYVAIFAPGVSWEWFMPDR